MQPVRGEETQPPAPIESRPVFHGTLPVKRSDGSQTMLQVEIGRRNLPHGARLEIPAGSGVTVMQLRGGHVKVSADGKIFSPRVDEFWLIDPVGTTTIEATSEEAVVEVVQAKPMR
jgi:hypothetical protein